MADLPPPEAMYDALSNRDSAAEGVFVFAVRTTGIFCRPTCAARRPNRANVEFFAAPRDALLAGYRACRKCRPLEVAGTTPEWLAPLLAEVEAEPTRRWTEDDLRARALEPARVRRWFQRHHGMTFHAYSRARRLGTALGHMVAGDDVLRAGAAAGFESDSGFRDAFEKHFGRTPGRMRGSKTATRVTLRRLTTPLGPMIAGATDDALCLLEFTDRRMFDTQIDRIRKHLDALFAPGNNAILDRTHTQLSDYFAGSRRSFDLPLLAPGSAFQQAAWSALDDIPYGATRSYADQAAAIGRPAAVRAIGRANGDNRIAIVIPCHRVVGKNGALTGYGGQVWRKQALLDLERETCAEDRAANDDPAQRKTARPPHDAATEPS